MQRHVPEELLEPCHWGPPLKGSTQEDIDRTALAHRNAHEDCLRKHNALVDYLRAMDNILKKSK